MNRLLLILSIFLAFYIATAHSFDADHENSVKPEVLLVRNVKISDYQLTDLNGFNSANNAAAPTLTLTVISYLSRIAQLSWITSEPVPDGTFFVERQVAASGTWEVIAQLPFNAILQFNDTISYPFCSPTDFLYRIRYESLVSGTIYSNEDAGNQLSDLNNPENVQNVIVSMTSSGKPIITWTQVTGDSILGYEINRFNGFSWQPVITLPADSSSYTDQMVMDGCSSSYAYLIITIDRCGLRSTPNYTNLTQTINLDLSPINECERLAKLSWNTYNAMPGGLGGYKIFRMVDYGTPVEIANLTDTLSTFYTDAYQFENGHNYTYYIEAYSASGSGYSKSCKQTKLYTGANVPDSIYITKVSVLSDSYTRTNYHSSPDSTVKKLILERSIDEGITFQAIDSLSVIGDYVPQDYYFDDFSADVHTKSYAYRLVAIDYCGTKMLYSNISRSILLQCSSSQSQNTIDWNTYESWMQNVEGYKVFRTVDGLPASGELRGSFTPATVSFPDLLTDIDPTKELCYWVVAQENPGNPYITDAESVSNTCCIVKGATLFLPNAFRPGGINDRFRPIASFVEPGSFKMTIFSRWGQMLFETTDMVNGWDGLVDGQIANSGLYAFIITYSSVGGQEYTKRGTVFVVR